MSTSTNELDIITQDYFELADGNMARDIYFNTSFLLNYLLKQQKGIWERPSGGFQIKVPLEYDGQNAAFYAKGDTVSSDDRESITEVFFDWKHAYSNATVYRIDGLKNAGEYATVQLATQRIGGAQKSATKLLASSIYDGPGGSANRLTGLLACCNETATLAYAGKAENDIVAEDGTKPWEGKVNSDGGSISLAKLRTACSIAKLYDGPTGKPDLIVTTETLYNVLSDILQAQQRFVDSSATAEAGFTGLKFEGKDIFPDDYCPSGYMFALNSNNVGFAVHKEGYFTRTAWKIIPDSPEDKTMKIYFDGNMIVNDRRAHIAYSGLN